MSDVVQYRFEEAAGEEIVEGRARAAVDPCSVAAAAPAGRADAEAAPVQMLIAAEGTRHRDDLFSRGLSTSDLDVLPLIFLPHHGNR